MQGTQAQPLIQELISHMLQGKQACALQPKILHDATKSPCAPIKNQFGQINK